MQNGFNKEILINFFNSKRDVNSNIEIVSTSIVLSVDEVLKNKETYNARVYFLYLEKQGFEKNLSKFFVDTMHLEKDTFKLFEKYKYYLLVSYNYLDDGILVKLYDKIFSKYVEFIIPENNKDLEDLIIRAKNFCIKDCKLKEIIFKR